MPHLSKTTRHVIGLCALAIVVILWWVGWLPFLASFAFAALLGAWVQGRLSRGH